MTIPATSALYTSDDQTWNTPKPVVDRLRLFDPRGVELDPCSNATSIVGARVEWRIERGEDGLALPWHSDYGPAFSNPPYEDLETWGRKMVMEGARGVEVIGLIPVRTDTKAFQRWLFQTCTAIHFWAGRMKYTTGPKHTSQVQMFAGLPELVEEQEEGENVAPFPSCLPYWGTRPCAFLRAFKPTGWGVVCR